jgi:hypothetical protein
MAAALALASCDRKEAANSSPPPAGDAPGTEPREAAQPEIVAPGPAEIWKEFSGDHAFEEVRKQVEIGPRPAGSPELEKTRELIASSLTANGWSVERQEFTDSTPRGPVKFVNLIGRFSAKRSEPPALTSQRAIVCSHYDTKRFSTIRFVGANDGASSTGALLELARVLALDRALAARVELVFFDGEEAFVQFSESDGLYGSRHYAAKLRDSGRARQFQFAILWDMIGDSELTITLAPDSPKELTQAILAAAEALSLRDRFTFYDRQIYDDHVPLNGIARIPAINLIDFDYLYWHTADDTLDRVSPASLQTIGAVTLFQLKAALSK